MAEEQEHPETRVLEEQVFVAETPLTREECFQLALREYFQVIQQAYPLSLPFVSKPTVLREPSSSIRRNFSETVIVQPPADLPPSISSGIDAVFLCACIGFLNLLIASGQPNLVATRTLKSFVPKQKTDEPSVISKEHADVSTVLAEQDTGTAFTSPKSRAKISSTILGPEADVVSNPMRSLSSEFSIQQLFDFSKELIAARKVLMSQNASIGEQENSSSNSKKFASFSQAFFSFLDWRSDKHLNPEERTLQGAYDTRKENVFAIVEAELRRLSKRIPSAEPSAPLDTTEPPTPPTTPIPIG